MAQLKPVLTPEAPAPGGHYSQAIVHQGVVYVAGQLPIAPGQTGHTVGPIEAQAKQILTNLEAILRAAGSRKELVLRVTVYNSDISLWSAFNQVYAEFFGDHRPARTVVPCNKLHYGYDVELDAIAAVDEAS
jgi:2-iminobutanoate/2-iminopropanoate deaminase